MPFELGQGPWPSQIQESGLILHTDNLFHLMTPGWTQIKYKNIHWIFILDLFTFLPQL